MRRRILLLLLCIAGCDDNVADVLRSRGDNDRGRTDGGDPPDRPGEAPRDPGRPDGGPDGGDQPRPREG